MKRFNKFQKGILGTNKHEPEKKYVDLKTYIKYLLKEGSIAEKREILSCLKSKLVMRNKKLEASN